MSKNKIIFSILSVLLGLFLVSMVSCSEAQGQTYVWLVSAVGKYETSATLGAVFLDVDTGKVLKTEGIGTAVHKTHCKISKI